MPREPAPRRPGTPRPPRAAAAALVVVLTFPGAACGALQQAAEPTPTPIPQQRAVERPTYRVERGDIVEQLSLSGRVSAVRQQDVGFAQGGRLRRVLVRVEDSVRRGQLLAELEQGELANALSKARLTLEQAQVVQRRGESAKRYAVANAELDLEEAQATQRAAKTPAEKELAGIGVRRAQLALSEAQSQTSEEAEKQIVAARLEYDRLAKQAEALRLYAPFGGQVTTVAAEPGAEVAEYQPVVTIVDPGERELRVEGVTGSDLARLGVGQRVDVRFSRYPDRPLTGNVEALPEDGGAEGQASSALRVSYRAPRGFQLEIGDLASITVTLQAKRGVVYLPPAAIRTFQGRQFVVIQQGERQRRVDVQVGITSDRRVEIVEGVSPGQTVVGQ